MPDADVRAVIRALRAGTEVLGREERRALLEHLVPALRVCRVGLDVYLALDEDQAKAFASIVVDRGAACVSAPPVLATPEEAAALEAPVRHVQVFVHHCRVIVYGSPDYSLVRHDRLSQRPFVTSSREFEPMESTRLEPGTYRAVVSLTASGPGVVLATLRRHDGTWHQLMAAQWGGRNARPVVMEVAEFDTGPGIAHLVVQVRARREAR